MRVIVVLMAAAAVQAACSRCTGAQQQQSGSPGVDREGRPVATDPVTQPGTPGTGTATEAKAPREPENRANEAEAYGLTTREWVVIKGKTARMGEPQDVDGQKVVEAFDYVTLAGDAGGAKGDKDPVELGLAVYEELEKQKEFTRGVPFIVLDPESAKGDQVAFTIGVPVRDKSPVKAPLVVKHIDRSRVYVEACPDARKCDPEAILENARKAGKVVPPAYGRLPDDWKKTDRASGFTIIVPLAGGTAAPASP